MKPKKNKKMRLTKNERAIYDIVNALNRIVRELPNDSLCEVFNGMRRIAEDLPDVKFPIRRSILDLYFEAKKL